MKKSNHRRRLLVVVVVGAAWLVVRPESENRPRARRSPAAGRDAATFTAADEDYFHDMDGGVAADARRRSRAGTPGSSGPAATTACGTD